MVNYWSKSVNLIEPRLTLIIQVMLQRGGTSCQKSMSTTCTSIISFLYDQTCIPLRKYHQPSYAGRSSPKVWLIALSQYHVAPIAECGWISFRDTWWNNMGFNNKSNQIKYHYLAKSIKIVIVWYYRYFFTSTRVFFFSFFLTA